MEDVSSSTGYLIEFLRAHKTATGSSQPFQSLVPHCLPLASVGAGLKCCLTPGVNFSQAGPTLHCSLNCTGGKAEQMAFFSFLCIIVLSSQ